MARFAGDRDPPQFREGFDPRLSPEPAIAGCAKPAERHLWLVLNRRPVDVANARSNPPRDPEAAGGVAREDGCAEAVFAIVGMDLKAPYF